MRLSRFLSATMLLFISIASRAQQTVGLFQNDAGSQDGYVLFAPFSYTHTYLIDKCGREVHEWHSTYTPGASVYLLPDGSLLRTGNTNNTTFNTGGTGGIIERLDWNSNVLWSYTISDMSQCQHHDICHLPNGNILAIVWEYKTPTEAIAAGAKPSLIGTAFWSEKIVELSPKDPNGATVVWEWHLWDHLVQDYAPTMPNFGTISAHPELVNLNYIVTPKVADWIHMNSIDYNPALDQIIVSAHNFNEIWIIDHSTTTAQAAGHTGGKYGKGGDLLYRWGNPAAYDQGTPANQKFFGEHDAQWIDTGLKDAGKIMVFNNGLERPGITTYSSVDIINPPIDGSGNYSYTSGTAYLPATTYWSYVADTPMNFFAGIISGCQRLPNGNTLICNGPSGEFFEIDSNKKTVWKYISPITDTGAMVQGDYPDQNFVFRCTLYPRNFPGFSKHTLIATKPLEINPLSYTCFTSGINTLPTAGTDITAMNPIQNKIVLKTERSINNVSLTVTNLTGSVVAKWNNITIAADQPSYFNISDQLPPGMYILSIASPAYKQYIKLVKE